MLFILTNKSMVKSNKKFTTRTKKGVLFGGLVGLMTLLFVLLTAQNALAAIAYGSVATQNATGVPSTTITITKPASTVSGNFLIADITFQGGTTITVTPPAGWTLILRTNNGTSVGTATYYKVAGGAEPANYTWTTTSTRQLGGIIRYTGVNNSSPIDVSAAATGNSTTPTAPTVTTTLANDRVLVFYGFSDDVTFSTPSGTTERFDIGRLGAADADSRATAASDFAQASAGATGTKSSTVSSNNNGTSLWTAQMIALAELDTTPPTITGVNEFDVDGDGSVDETLLTFSEKITDATVTPADFTIGGTAADTKMATTSTNGTDLNVANDNQITIKVAAGVVGTETKDVVYTRGSLTDLAGNFMVNQTVLAAAVTDDADPVVVSTTPANRAINIVPTSNVIINFSEAMDTGVGLTISDDDTNSYNPATWTNGDKTATVSHRVWTISKLVTVSIDGQDASAKGNSLYGGGGYNWSFTIRSGGGGGTYYDSIPPDAPSNIHLTADASGKVTITWADPTNSDLSLIFIQRDHDPIPGTVVDSIYAEVAKGVQTFTETGLTPGETYLYRVRSQDTSGNISTKMETYSVIIPSGQGQTSGAPTTTTPTVPAGLVLHDPEPAGSLPQGVQVGTLVKRSDMSVVYFIDQDNRRHAFPNQTVYFSWFSDFSNVQTISAETLAAIPLGSNVTMRPGTWLIKIQSDPKVYAVEPYGVIRWLQSEAIASSLYGTDWNTRIVDIEPTFFGDYQTGSAVESLSHPTGSVIQYADSPSDFFIDNGVRELISSDVFTNNLFQDKFVIKNVPTSISYTNGTDMLAMTADQLITLK